MNLIPTDGLVVDSEIREWWALYNMDCVEGCKRLPDASIGYSISSIPFASLYTYSNSPRDMGNCRTHGEFYDHFRFLAADWLRVTKPGRLCSIHVMNLPTSKSRDGYIGIDDFRGDIIRIFEDAGWIYHSEVVIWKDPVTAMQRTKALGLLHKQLKKDSAMSRQGIPDYLLQFVRAPNAPDDSGAWGALMSFLRFVLLFIFGDALDKAQAEMDRAVAALFPPSLVTFRKPGENPEPIEHTNDSFPVQVWQRYASPVWMDINATETLQYMSAREHEDERHICPLQLEVIRRGIALWSNSGDTVASMFAGIGSELHEAVKMRRRAVGFELKGSYFRQAVKNLARVEPGAKGAQTDLLDLGAATAPRGGKITSVTVQTPAGTSTARLDPPMPLASGEPVTVKLPNPEDVSEIIAVNVTGMSNEQIADVARSMGATRILKPHPMGRCEGCDDPGPVGTCATCGSEVRA